MARDPYSNEKRELSRRLTVFFGRRGCGEHSLRNSLREICGAGESWSSFIFGGVLRDLTVLGPNVSPRDLDIVVGHLPTGFASSLAERIQRTTRFGGYRMDAAGWKVDIWALEHTWAFRQGVVSNGSFENLPKTTFLNIHAVAAEVLPQQGKPRKIFAQQGFFEAVRSRVIDVLCEENPYPLLSVVRALRTASRLGFGLGPRLVKYLDRHGHRADLEELEAVQRQHYGRLVFDRDSLRRYMTAVRDHLRAFGSTVLKLPGVLGQQLRFPATATMWADQSPEPECSIRRCPIKGQRADGGSGNSQARKVKHPSRENTPSCDGGDTCPDVQALPLFC